MKKLKKQGEFTKQLDLEKEEIALLTNNETLSIRGGGGKPVDMIAIGHGGGSNPAPTYTCVTQAETCTETWAACPTWLACY